jgi:CheY-like chemotaxis protein
MPMTQPILLVEDDENDVRFMKMAMQEAKVGNQLQVAKHGREALEYMSGTGKYADRETYPLPCLILLDLKLPYVPGLEVLKSIREDPRMKEIIVIILTSSQELSDIDRAYSLGANAFVAKPPNIQILQKLAKAIHDFWLVFNASSRSDASAQEI